MPFVQAGPVKLEYFEQGAGPRTWVLIHGFRSSALIWDAMQAHLAASGDRTIAISMRGAGGSDETPDDEDYAPAHFAHDVHAAVEALNLPDRFYLVGHSLGASTVTHYAREHADRLAGLVLLAGGAMRPRQPRTEAERAEWLAQIDAYPGNIDRPYWEREHVGLSQQVRDQLWRDWLNVSKQRMRGARAEVPDAPTELEPTLRAMQVPTLVMFGDDDHTVSPGLSAEGYLMLPSDIRHLHVLHGIDHSPNSVVPQETGDVFMRFARHLEGFAAK